jgi:hypothetical protein
MSDAKALEFTGTDEELEKRLLEFTRAVGGWAARDPRHGGWRLTSGSLLSTNPNTIRWRMTLSRQGRDLRIASTGSPLPWTRAKIGRIVALRRSQLEDMLMGRGAPPARGPFATFGSDPAAITAGFAWSVACGLAGMAAAVVATTVASLPLMGIAIDDVLGRSRAALAAGAVALPNPDQPLSALGAAFVFAVPLAFLGGLTHGMALAVAEGWDRADRLPLASLLFLTILLGAAFLPFLPLLALPAAAGVPLAIHAGYTILWGRRLERRREGRRPRRGVVLAGTALAVLVVAALLGSLRGPGEFPVRVALFRDRFLLGNSLGRAAARVYYAHTLVSADPLLKQFYSSDERVASRLLRTARSDDPKAAEQLRALHFTIVPASVASDVRLEKGWLGSGSHSVPWTGDPEALDRLAREAFRGSWLHEVYGLAWFSLYYAGPVVLLLAVLGALAPAFSVLFRVLRPKAALAACIACFLASSALLLALSEGEESAQDALRVLRRAPEPPRLVEGLAHPSTAVRHEAAFQAYVHPDRSLGPALLKAADDRDLRVRLWAVAALGKAGPPDALAKLVARLDDPELFVRYRAAEGLGFLKRPEAVGPLLRMTREASWYEGLYALEALRKINPERF